MKNFIGIGRPYDATETAEIYIDTTKMDSAQTVEIILNFYAHNK